MMFNRNMTKRMQVAILKCYKNNFRAVDQYEGVIDSDFLYKLIEPLEHILLDSLKFPKESKTFCRDYWDDQIREYVVDKKTKLTEEEFINWLENESIELLERLKRKAIKLCSTKTK